VAQNDGSSAERKSHPGSQKIAVALKGVFVCNGEFWTIGYADASFSLRDVKGLGYIQRMLQHPGEEFHSLDLLNVPGAGDSAELDDAVKAALLAGATIRVGLGDSGEMLDAKARHDYERRIVALREELEDRRERGDKKGVASAEAELDFLLREVARAVGLGGRIRRAGAAAERARLNVTRAIKSALQKISEHHPQLGNLLDRSIKTGTFSCYLPNPQNLIAWQFSVGREQSAVAEVTAPVFSRPENSLVQSLADRTTFVGREAERAVLRRLLERTLGREERAESR